MTANPYRDRYVGDSISTASPARLLTMLYDRLLVDLAGASAAVAGGDIEAAGTALCHAQDIVLELHASLDANAWEGGPGLSQLYTFLLRRLVEANVAKDAAIVDECRTLVEPLRAAWHDAARSVASSSPALASTA